MKIRQDFVTNSSSTSFGAAAATGFASALMSVLGISSAMAASGAADGLPDGVDTGSRSCPNRDFDPDEFIHSDIGYGSKVAQLDHEIGEYQKEWEETKDTLEGADYEETKKEYDDYIKHLSDKKEEAGHIEFEKQLDILAKEAEIEHKSEWLDRRKDDLKNTRDQIEMIEASIKGYGTAGYDISEAKSQLEVYKGREKDLTKTLTEEGVDYKYEAKKREPIGPSKSIAASLKEVDAIYDKVFEDLKNKKIDRKKKEIIKRNMNAWRAEGRAYTKFGNLSDKYLKRAEAIQAAADVGVDALEKVTGPAGKTIKKIYVGTKAVATGTTEAYLDPANAGSHMAKGLVKGAGDVAKEYFPDNQLAKDGIGFVSEATQGAIDSHQKGKSITSGVVSGMKKATIDAVVDRVTGKFLPDSSSGLNIGEYTGKEIFKATIKGNPTVKNIIRDTFKDALKNNAINQGKNIPKGDGFIFGDLKISM